MKQTASFKNLYIGILVSLMPVSGFLFSYFKFDFFSSMYFPGDDQNCDLSSGEGIGVHCFGDLQEGMISERGYQPDLIKEKIWLNPSDGLIAMISNPLSQLIGVRLVVILVLASAFMLMTAPFMHLNRLGQQKGTKDTVMLLLILFSFPFVFIMDRLNAIYLAVPLFFFYVLSLTKAHFLKTVVLFSALCVVKPQFFLFIILCFQTFGLLKSFFAAMVSTLSAVGAVFIHRGAVDLEVIRDWLLNIVNYGNTNSPINNDYPANYSFARTAYYVGTRLFVPENIAYYAKELGLIFSLTLIGIVMLRKNRDIFDNLFIVSYVAFFTLPSVTFGYYLAVLLLIEMLRLAVAPTTSIFRLDVVGASFELKLRMALYCVIMLPVPIPIIGFFAEIGAGSPAPILNPIIFNILSTWYIVYLVGRPSRYSLQVQ